MSRRKAFVVQVDVSDEFLRDDPPMARALAETILRDKARDPLTGPRGGQYLPDSEPYDFREGVTSDGFMRNQVTFIARVVGRYVRPNRRQSA